MPYVNIKVTDEGVTRKQKETLIVATTRLLKEVLNKDPASTFIIIEEISTDNWGIGGELVTEIRTRDAVKR